MATPKPTTPHREYEVLISYQCPIHKHWHEVKEKVNYLPSQASLLLISGHLAPVESKTKPVNKKEVSNA